MTMELPLVTAIFLALPAYRLARIVGVDNVGEPLRQFLYRKQAQWGKTGRWLHKLFTCPFCLSVWFSGLATLWWVWLILPAWPGFGFVLLMIGAVAGAACLMVSADMAAHKYIES
jgi:hypothetical protein